MDRKAITAAYLLNHGGGPFAYTPPWGQAGVAVAMATDNKHTVDSIEDGRERSYRVWWLLEFDAPAEYGPWEAK